MLEILVIKYSIPENFYSDKHTILISPKDSNLTNFSHMCEDLGINIIAANTPQAKGKVEKWNNTIQNRLINDIIDNQKQLERVLRERDERLKARANKVSS